MLPTFVRWIALPFVTTLSLSAQIVGGVPGGVIGGSRTASQAPAAPGSATLRGHVFAADTSQPLRKAQVRIFAGEIGENRMASTDDHGGYEFNEVRAGRYTISASKGSYVSVSYGQQRPGDAPKPLEILDNQTVERVDLTLPRGSVITGRIVDEYGEPAPEIQVAAQRYLFIQGQRRLVPTGRTVSTNDLGDFRLFGIPPGQYYISATWRNTNGGNPNGSTSDRTAYAPTYFPGTTNASDAQRITLAAGQELDDLVMILKPIKAARVTGTATGSDGKPLTPAMIMVTQSNGFGFSVPSVAPVRPDGTFTINGLAPDEYTLRAQRMGGAPGEGPETAMTTLTVTGEDIPNVHLVAAKPSTLTGRIIVDPAAPQSLPPGLTISAVPATVIGIPAPPPPPARVSDDYSFEMKATPGRMRITLGGFNAPPTGWSVRSVRLNGVDVTDTGIEFKPNEDISGVDVELTNRLTSLSGLVTSGRGEPSMDYTAIVFAQDKDKWTGNSRYQGTGRPDQDGRFKISGLPPGDYYIAAVDRIEPGESSDPDFLENLRSRATSLSLSEGETKTVDLRLNSAR